MPQKVLFACVHNAGRSQMAAAFFRQLADPEKVEAISAGLEPAQRREDWDLADPAGRPVAEVRRIRDVIRERVQRLVADKGWSR